MLRTLWLSMLSTITLVGVHNVLVGVHNVFGGCPQCIEFSECLERYSFSHTLGFIALPL
jgi:hypothetical protein